MFKIKGLVQKGDYSRIERRGRSTAEENVIAVVSSVESTPWDEANSIVKEKGRYSQKMKVSLRITLTGGGEEGMMDTYDCQV